MRNRGDFRRKLVSVVRNEFTRSVQEADQVARRAHRFSRALFTTESVQRQVLLLLLLYVCLTPPPPPPPLLLLGGVQALQGPLLRRGREGVQADYT